MGIGLSRNEANKILIKCRESGVSYKKYYEYECSWLRISIATQKVGCSFKNVVKAFNIANSTVRSFSEAMRVAIQNRETYIDEEDNLDGCLIGHNDIISNV